MIWLTFNLVCFFCVKYVIAATIESCDSDIYCKGTLLNTIQYSVKIYNDSKVFVDLSQKHSPEVTLANFKSLMTKTNNKPSLKDVVEYLKDNFDEEGELENWTPPDFKSNPAFLNKITNSSTRNFAKKLVSIWPMLARKVKPEVLKYPDRHSLIAVPNGFVIPGGRFKEIYYWDSYWIIRGLLVSEMTTTAKGMIENLLSLVQRYGFVPNGSRVYYLNRSQPPLLSLMVKLYIDATNDLPWLKRIIGTLERELNWWQANRTVSVEKNDITYKMARYAVESNTPRPESYSEDIETCNFYTQQADKEKCYQNLKSGAESGWDFSSRWVIDPTRKSSINLAFVKARKIIPVDLNAFLCRAHKEVARYHDLLGNVKEAAEWYEKAQIIQKSIEAVLYNIDDGIWYDYDIDSKTSRKKFHPSNFAPLWAESYNTFLKNGYGARAAKYFVKQVNQSEFLGGIPASLTNTGEQWDLPNAWPPLQEIMIMGLYGTENTDAQKIALTYAQRWIEANEIGYTNTDDMFEKYDSVVPGQYGGGGEYTVQTGFGWTNGVVLSLLDEFPTLFQGSNSGFSSMKSSLGVMLPVVCVWVMGLIIKI